MAQRLALQVLAMQLGMDWNRPTKELRRAISRRLYVIADWLG